MFSFFKKNKQPAADIAPKENIPLDNIEFHTMPEKFRNAGGVSAAPAKTMGLLIIAGGGLILAVSAGLLIWYIYSSGGQNKIDSSGLIGQTETTPVAESTSGTVGTTAANTAEDLTEKDCGQGFYNASTTDYGTDAAFVCLSEQINNNCHPAAAKITDGNFGEVKFSILGLRQDKCLAQIDYLDADAVISEEMKIYAGAAAQCLYNFSDLSIFINQSGQSAAYLYKQLDINVSKTNDNCSGTAIERARELAKPAAEIETAQLGVDTDGDLLTDLEETAVFATDINKNDTDGDSFSDGAEVLNLYNPAGAGKLSDSGLTAEYQNSKYGYSVFYPKSFRLEDQLGGDNVFFFSGVDGSIQILAQDNADKKDIKSWYAALVNSIADEVQTEVKTTKNSGEYIFSLDGLTAYITFAQSDKVFVLTYSPEETGSIQFKTVLNMMINSFQLK
jgi:hypothetical protein